eukprot:895155-Pelagomonas_calceolata.AAC.2
MSWHKKTWNAQAMPKLALELLMADTTPPNLRPTGSRPSIVASSPLGKNTVLLQEQPAGTVDAVHLA